MSQEREGSRRNGSREPERADGGVAERAADGVGAILRAARRRRGLTQDALAAAIGCCKSHLSQMESGARQITLARARALECALGLTDRRLQQAAAWSRTPEPVRAEVASTRARQRALAAHLRAALGASNPVAALRTMLEDRLSNIDADSPRAAGLARIPLINRVPAGAPVEFTDLGYPAAVADAYVPGPNPDDPDAFAARVTGDSMLPEYRDGEIVVFSPALPTPDGSDCFVRLARDDETTFKRVFFEDAGRVLRLQPLNPAHEARRIEREAVAGLFAAAYVLRRVQPGTHLRHARSR